MPESPRWLFIHGRAEEAERIVDEIEAEVKRETGHQLPPPEFQIAVHPRDAIPFREIAGVAFRRYPSARSSARALHRAGVPLQRRHLRPRHDPARVLRRRSGRCRGSWSLFAAGNFLGPLLLGRLFDTVGRIPMIAGTYLGSAAVVRLLALLLRAAA